MLPSVVTRLKSRLVRLVVEGVNMKTVEPVDALFKAGTCVSDDQHIIGFAQLSGVRLPCSIDGALQTDFTNHLLLSPRGRVYKRAEHANLITEECAGLRPDSPQKRPRPRRRRRRRLGSR